MAISAHCIRMGAVRFCLAMMMGLLVVSGYVVAPVLFAKAASHQEAGMLAGHIFHIVNISVLFLAVAVASFWFRMSVGRFYWILLVILMILLSVNEFAISPWMQALKDSVASVSALPKDSPIYAKFSIYHGISAIAHLIATVSAIILVAMGGQSISAVKEDYAS